MIPDPPRQNQPLDLHEAALALEGVGKTFLIGRRRVEALRDVTVQVRRGVVTGLIGPDGAGKTTLMRLAVGLLVPDAGRVHVLGMDASRDSLAVQGVVGYMPQRFGLYEDLTVQENLDLYADLQGVPRQRRTERLKVLMHMTGLAPFMARLAGRLSGGMKQKLGLACTLVRPHQVLLLDEPTVGVDPLSRRELWSIVYRLVKEEGMTVLLSTAYLDEAERCHEVVMLHEGRLLGHGSPEHYRDTMAGRAYLITVPGGGKRHVQAEFAGLPQVIDATIQGDRVRLVTDVAGGDDLRAWLPDLPGALMEPVSPRFEDAFIALLRKQQPRERGAPAGKRARQAAGTAPFAAKRVIEVGDVGRRFGSFDAVKDVAFHVNEGEVFGLLGANGAGKTTTFRMLCGLLPASSGTLRVAGVDLRRAPAVARARIGYMSQRFSLYGNLGVRENLEFFSGVYGLAGRRRRSQVQWALDEFQLADVADAASINLPLGFKQRLALACALMHEPKILFLDEPTSGVDPVARREFWHRINRLAEQNVTILVTTHFMEEAEYCDRLAIMAAGSILALGTPAEIRQRARSAECPQPTMEDAFVGLIQQSEGRSSAGSVATC
jgi:ABC-2 type transport system ATP-binding protein